MHYLLKDAGVRDPDVKESGIIHETSGPFRALFLRNFLLSRVHSHDYAVSLSITPSPS